MGEYPIDPFARTNGQNNPKTSNPEDLSLFEHSVTERRTRQRAECFQVNGTTETIEELDKLHQIIEG